MNKKVVSPFTQLLMEQRKTDWCRKCIKQIVNEKVIDFSKQKYGLPICFKCQQTITHEEVEKLIKDEVPE